MTISFLEKKLIREFPDAKGNFPEFRICCPFCAESRHRMGINLEKMVGHCFNCEETVGRRALMAMIKCSTEHRKENNDFESLEREFVEEQIKPQRTINHLREKFLTWAEAASQIPELVQKASLYLNSRGLPKHNFWEDDILFPHPSVRRLSGRVILPVYEDGKLVYYQARSLDNQQMPKYLNPPRSPDSAGKSDFVYNLDEAGKYPEIVICEGIFSAMSVGPQAVAIFGKQMSSTQFRKIVVKKPKNILIMLDPGAEREACSIASRLWTRVRTRIARLRTGDPNEVTEAELRSVMSCAELFEDDIFADS